MPYIETKTTRKIDKATADGLREELGRAIELIPGKTEKWLMLSFIDGLDMALAGVPGDAAMIDVSLLGHADDGAYAALTEKICEIVSCALEIPKDRIYIKYSEYERWGWNGINL